MSADYLDPENYQHNMGRSYSNLIDTRTGKPLDEATYDEMIKKDPNHPVLFYNATEEWGQKSRTTWRILGRPILFCLQGSPGGGRAPESEAH